MKLMVFIYDINQNLYKNMAKDVLRVVNNPSLREKIIFNKKK